MSKPPGPGRPAARSIAFGAVGMVLVGSSVAVSRTLTAAPLCTVQAIRYSMAAVILVAVARRLRIPIAAPRGREWLLLAGLSAAGLVLFNVAIVRGVAHAQPAMIAVAVACVPVLLGVLGPLMQGQRPRLPVVVAAAIVTVGAVLVEGAGHASAAAIAWATLALACEAAFTLLAVPLLPRHGAWGVSVHAVWLGAVMFAVLGGITDGPAAAARLTASDLVAASYLAVLVTVAAFVLWYSAVAALGPGRAGLITGIAPVAAAMTGIALGSRAPDPLMWAGIAVVAGGLAAGLSARCSAPGPGYARPVISSPQARAAADDGSVNRASRALATRAAYGSAAACSPQRLKNMCDHQSAYSWYRQVRARHVPE
jgi:drug/metabolite transporter (DMT)-like permease